MFTVQVWFATTFDYSPVLRTSNEDYARKEARAYDSDSRATRIIRPDGSIEQIKPESHTGR